MSVTEVLESIRDESTSESDKGTRFERLMVEAFRTDRTYRERFSHVWMWMDWPAVAWDASVPLADGGSTPFLDAMHQIEATILNGAATDAELLEAELLAQRVRHAG
jgi:hypothetical protein